MLGLVVGWTFDSALDFNKNCTKHKDKNKIWTPNKEIYFYYKYFWSTHDFVFVLLTASY